MDNDVGSLCAEDPKILFQEMLWPAWKIIWKFYL